MDNPTEEQAARMGRYEFVVAEAYRSQNPHRGAQPCDSLEEKDCAEWVSEALTAAYNE